MFIMDTSRFVTVKPDSMGWAAGVARTMDAVRYQGRTYQEWAEHFNVPLQTIHYHMKRWGDLSHVRANLVGRRARRVRTPHGVYDSVKHAVEATGVTQHALYHYLKSGKPGYSYVV